MTRRAVSGPRKDRFILEPTTRPSVRPLAADRQSGKATETDTTLSQFRNLLQTKQVPLLDTPSMNLGYSYLGQVCSAKACFSYTHDVETQAAWNKDCRARLCHSSRVPCKPIARRAFHSRQGSTGHSTRSRHRAGKGGSCKRRYRRYPAGYNSVSSTPKSPHVMEP